MSLFLFKRFGILAIFISLLSFISKAQTTYLPLKYQSDHFSFEKKAYEILNFHTSVKPYVWEEIFKDSTYNGLPFSVLKNKSASSSLLSTEPIFSVSAQSDVSSKKINYTGIAGVAVHSVLMKNLIVHADFIYGMSKFPEFVSKNIDTTSIIPHFGKYNSKNSEHYLYSSLTGYVSYKPYEFLTLEMGRGKNFWGDGYRSLLLSENSNAYPYFKTTVNIWRFKYTHLLMSLRDYEFKNSKTDLKRKYAATHFLSINLTKNISINAFEAVIFNPTDSIGGNRGFDVNYLNPVAFYRPVEFSIGSPDNVLLGFGFKIRFFKKYNVYGQVILDEFILAKVKARAGAWENKHGFQMGLKAFEPFGIKQLLVQGEINYVRPFTYSHQYSIKNYGAYYQPLAHPLGGNFGEIVGLVNYSFKKFSINAKLVYSIHGGNTDTTSKGGDIYVSYMKRYSQTNKRDLGHETTQGLKTTLIYGEFKLSYLLVPSLSMRLETGIIFRRQTNTYLNLDNKFVFLGFKTNFGNDSYDY